jgi:UDP-galactopyranose mutase
MYDFLIVGAGLFGSTFANLAHNKGYKVLVIDKRNHIGGNIYTEKIEDINVHKYGAHIFHTNNKDVWNYVNKFSNFNRYTNSPIANYDGEIFSLPFNMYTFNKMWGVVTPQEAMEKIENSKKDLKIEKITNLEEQAISLVGYDIYKKLIKEYTEKQWGRPCKELPPSIITRLPIRLSYDNNYFNALYQGIPVIGYTNLIKNMLNGIDIRLNVDYLKEKEKYSNIAKKIIYTGPIDEFYDYKLGNLEYRSVKFETEILDIENFQGNAVVNYTSNKVPYTRIIEHKFFEFGTQPKTIISKEYSIEWKISIEPYYPINNDKNNKLYQKYKELSNENTNIVFGGRLGDYKYYDMDKTIEKAFELAYELL